MVRMWVGERRWRGTPGDTSSWWDQNSRVDWITGDDKGISFKEQCTPMPKRSLRRVNKNKDKTYTGEHGHGKTPTAMLPAEGIEQRHSLGPTSPEMHALSCPSKPWMEKTIPGSVDQSSKMEHDLRWDEGWLLEVYNKVKTRAWIKWQRRLRSWVQAAWLADAWPWKMPLMYGYIRHPCRCKCADRGDMSETQGAVAKPKGRTFHW